MVESATIAYMGTNYSMKVLLNEHMIEEFEKSHKETNGFSLPNKAYKIEYYIQTFIRRPTEYNSDFKVPCETPAENFSIGQCEVFLNGRVQSVSKYKLVGMLNCRVDGPALIFSETSSILVQEKWKAHIVNETVHLSNTQDQQIQSG
jgi:N-methylhydantoinase A/oxoprolinase/acetone carboxylase beta subunit